MEKHELQEVIESLYTRYLPLTSGEVATYIPELAKTPPDNFGIAIATSAGRLFEAGQSDTPFTIQSISKPLTFGMAVEIYGPTKVAEHVGVEPSGDAFNSIELQTPGNRPHNPMVNAGAISVTALLHRRYRDDTTAMILEKLSTAAGRQLEVDEEVFLSEERTGHRNRAIAHLLLNFGVVHEEAEYALDAYFRQCAILVTARDLAMIGATLANMGCNPITGKQVFDITTVRSILSIMFTCGMYDYSGEWAYRVGVPAKSRRRDGCRQPPARHCHVLAEAGCPWQQRARHRSVRRACLAVRPAHVRLPQRGVELRAGDAGGWELVLPFALCPS